MLAGSPLPCPSLHCIHRLAAPGLAVQPVVRTSSRKRKLPGHLADSDAAGISASSLPCTCLAVIAPPAPLAVSSSSAQSDGVEDESASDELDSTVIEGDDGALFDPITDFVDVLKAVARGDNVDVATDSGSDSSNGTALAS